jgi:hypothetical protein
MMMRTLVDYSGLHRSRVECATPRNEEELASLLSLARGKGRRVTVRGGGECLHGQSIGDDLVVDLQCLDRVVIDLDRRRLTAKGGATWGSVVRALPNGWVLPNLVTTPYASVGGTLAGDAVSRFSSAFGREAASVSTLRVMLADGTIHRISRLGQGGELFEAFVGSLGALGIILSVEHELCDLRPIARAATDGVLRVQTIAHRCPSLTVLVEHLARSLVEPVDIEAPVGTCALLIPGGRGLVFRSSYSSAPVARRMPNTRQAGPIRRWCEHALANASINRAVWGAIYEHFYADGDIFIDPLEDFLFFMSARPRGRSITQQVLELPFDPNDADSLRNAAAALRALEAHLDDARMSPLSCDLVPVRDSNQLRVAMAFPVDARSNTAALRSGLRRVADVVASFGGAVHLSKGVFASSRTLGRGHAARLKRLFEWKRRTDPTDLLRSPFFDHVLRPAADSIPLELLDRPLLAGAGNTEMRLGGATARIA